ncbi:MAG: hypothetical protein Ct9H300mP13_1750 [Gammaproteobacteria bacterium]|nr:MAG: hypothetical protein Ct9H300mP13_1750 [Gammaproteobacteria bacterium]
MNQIVDDRVRGRWMGIYVTVGMAGWALGPLLGAYLDPASYWPFLWGLLAIVVAAVFLLPTRKLDVRLRVSPQGIAVGLATVFLSRRRSSCHQPCLVLSKARCNRSLISTPWTFWVHSFVKPVMRLSGSAP